MPVCAVDAEPMARDDHLPFRQATRLVNEYQLRVASVVLALTGRELYQVSTLLLIHRATIRDPSDLRVSFHGLAASLRRPSETVRRAVHGLVAHGFCERAERGVRRRPSFLAMPAIIAAEHRFREALGDLIDGLQRAGFALPAGLHDAPPSARVTAALDVQLCAVEFAQPGLGRPLDLYLLGVVSVLNAAKLTHDPALSQRYGTDHPVAPDALRCPATIADIAALDGFPRTTIWHRARAAEAAGALRRAPGGGYLLAEKFLHKDPSTAALDRSKIRYILRVFHDLAAGRSG